MSANDLIIVTGANGFVGSNLIPYLTEHSIKTILLSRDELAGKIVFPQNGKVIIHLAGKAHDTKSVVDPDEYYRVNYMLTQKLYDAFLKSDAEKFIFISSVKAAADQVNGVLTEKEPPNPETDYGKSKLLAEQYIESQQLPDGKKYFILRPCMIHGPGNKGNLNLLYKVVKNGFPYPLAGFVNKRSFLSVQNLCFIIKELVTSQNIMPGVYHIADDGFLSTNEVVTVLAASLNLKPRLWSISPAIIKYFARLGTLLHLPLTSERLTKLTESYLVSNNKIKHAIKQPLPLSIKEGLQITATSFSKA